jgi:hypothetical protein
VSSVISFGSGQGTPRLSTVENYPCSMPHERHNRLTNIDLSSVPQVGYSGVDLWMWCECLFARCARTIMAVEQPAQPFSASDGIIGLSTEISRCYQYHMALALMKAFLVIMSDGCL